MKKVAGMDQIHAKFLKEAAEVLDYSQPKIFR